MPDNKYAQKGPINGGDDDSSGSVQAEAPKKLDMRKYINKPDLNVRDLFWTIMLAYAAKENVKEALKSFYGQRMSLLRVAVSVIQQPDKFLTEEMEVKDVAEYTLKMILDEGWIDVFSALIANTYNMKDGVCFPLVIAMKKLCATEEYVKKIDEFAKELILNDQETEGLLAYLAEINDAKLSEMMKKELMILASEGLDQIQHYAMFALKPIAEKEDVQNTLIRLMDSWDDETRRIAANILQEIKSEKVISAAKKQMELEDVEEIKETLKKIIGKSQGEN
jgi:hypothetical protein